MLSMWDAPSDRDYYDQFRLEADEPEPEEIEDDMERESDEILRLKSALRAIASLGGNLPDKRFTDRTGPADAQYRGEMYCEARSIARKALGIYPATDDEECPF